MALNQLTKKLLCLSLTALAAGAFAAGCDKSDKTTAAGDGTAAGGGGKAHTFAFVTNNASDFWNIARAGTEKAKKELPGVEVRFEIPEDGTAATQQRKVDDLLTTGVSGIAISPIDPANQTTMLNDIAKRTLLVTQDSDAPDTNRAFYVGTDNVAAGRQAGKVLKEALPDGGTVMLFVGSTDAQNAADRQKGIEQAIEGTNIKILGTRTDDTDRTRAQANAADALVKYPDLGAMVGLWSYNTPAILKAVRSGGDNAKNVKIVGFDEEDDTLGGVASGEIVATIVQQPFEFGYQAIKMMNAYANGDKSVVPADGKKYVETLIIDKDKVGAFKENLQKLRK